MNEDILFKTTVLGGFKKETVIEYIENLKNEHIKALNEKDKQLAIANEQLSASNSQSEFEPKFHPINVDKKSAEISEKEYVTALEAENAKLKKQIQLLEFESAKLREIETQIGSLMIDARFYSEKLRNEAISQAEEISKNTYSTIISATDEIGSLTGDINVISGEFTQTVSSLVEKVNGFSSKLNDTVYSWQIKEGILSKVETEATDHKLEVIEFSQKDTEENSESNAKFILDTVKDEAETIEEQPKSTDSEQNHLEISKGLNTENSSKVQKEKEKEKSINNDLEQYLKPTDFRLWNKEKTSETQFGQYPNVFDFKNKPKENQNESKPIEEEFLDDLDFRI